MVEPKPPVDVGREARARHETPAERFDRNWSDLIQELRVVQTGVQFLTGFLLTLPFQSRFEKLTQEQENVYLATVVSAILSTAFLQAPVGVHRALFRRHQKAQAVTVAHRVAMVGMVFLALAVVGVAALIFDVVSGRSSALAAAVGVAALLAVLWLGMPWYLRAEKEDDA